MATIYIDNEGHEVKDGQNLLNACLSLGFDIPYFCWHPALGSVGSCRLCAVKRFKDKDDRDGEIVMSCMTPVEDGLRISIEDPDVRVFRAGVIEWLMVNHPHDCPVCDEGGECHLQDMTVMTGHSCREYRFRKRTFRNQDLGPFLNHEMNRCIQCYRCLRFYRHYAGGRDFGVFGAHDRLYFGHRHEGPLENEFSGNLVELCPTGVFTDKTFKAHYSRKWDLQTAPSICVHCGLGCNTLPGERYGTLRCIRNRYHHRINGYFLCDRGRFGYGFVNSDRRVREPRARLNGNSILARVPAEAVLRRASGWLAAGQKVIGIGSPRASLEANFALQCLVGPRHFYAGLSRSDVDLLREQLSILRRGALPVVSLQETAGADAVFVLGEDVTQTAPLLALVLRQLKRPRGAKRADSVQVPEWNAAGRREIIQQEKAPLFMAVPCATKLDPIAALAHHDHVENLERLGFAVAHCLDPGAPSASPPGQNGRQLAETIASALLNAKRPLIVSGGGCRSRGIVRAAADIASALKRRGRTAGIFLTTAECNSMGLAMLGSAGALEDAFERAGRDGSEAAVILENDLHRRIGAGAVADFFDRAAHVLTIDHLTHPTLQQSEAVLPAATFAESSGTLVNNECRAQRFFQVFPAGGEIRESWRWLRELGAAAGRIERDSWQRLDDVCRDLAHSRAEFQAILEAAPGADFRAVGGRIPRQSHRYSGRTAMHAQIDVHEPRPVRDPDSPLAFSMEGDPEPPPPPLIQRYWAPGWNSVQAVNKFQSEVAGPLMGAESGQRMIEPTEQGEIPYFGFEEPSSPIESGRWRIIPLHYIFGSEELSTFSPAVAERVPPPCATLGSEEAASLGVAEGERLRLMINDRELVLPVHLCPDLPAGAVGLPMGLPGMPFTDPDTTVVIRKEKTHA